MDFRSEFVVQPGQDVKLAKVDAGYHGPHASEDEAKDDVEAYKDKISKLQRTLYGDRSKALLIVLQGIDGAGKDGTCWHVISAMDPQGVKVTGFKQRPPRARSPCSTALTTRTF
jgi:polyphosphate kinase 2 (PPK2 family)